MNTSHIDDGTLDEREVNHLLGLAMRDDIIAEDEKRVIGNIFSKISSHEVSKETWAIIQKAKEVHGI